MMLRTALAMLILSCRCFAGLPPVEGELGSTPEQPSADHWRRWKFRPQETESDEHGDYWWFQFKIGSDKRLGTAADEVAIKAFVPAGIPPMVRWVSKSGVVVLSACRIDATSVKLRRCLYVFEKHHRKWNLTHHYPFCSGSPTF
jgi:hypothetical protein